MNFDQGTRIYFKAESKEQVLKNLNSSLGEAQVRIDKLEQVDSELRFWKSIDQLLQVVPCGCAESTQAVRETLIQNFDTYTEDNNIRSAWNVVNSIWNGSLELEDFRQISLNLCYGSEALKEDALCRLVKTLRHHHLFDSIVNLKRFFGPQDPLYSKLEQAIELEHRQFSMYQTFVSGLDFKALCEGDLQAWQKAKDTVRLLKEDLCLEEVGSPVIVDANMALYKQSDKGADFKFLLETSIQNWQRIQSCLMTLDLPGIVGDDYIVQSQSLFSAIEDSLLEIEYADDTENDSTEQIAAMTRVKEVIEKTFALGMPVYGEEMSLGIERGLGRTITHLLVESISYEQLVECLSSVNVPRDIINARDGVGRTPLFSFYNHSESLEANLNRLDFLHKKGADLSIQSYSGDSFLHDCVTSNSDNSVLELFDFAKENGFDLSNDGRYYNSLASVAIARDRSDVLNYLLSKNSLALNCRREGHQGYIYNGYSPLDDAVSKGVRDLYPKFNGLENIKIIQSLLDYGFRPDDGYQAVNHFKRSTIFLAIACLNTEGVKLLLKYGASLPKTPSEVGRYFFLSNPNRMDQLDQSKLQISFLVEEGLDINACDEKDPRTCLDLYVNTGWAWKEEFISFLQSQGAKKYSELF